MSSWNKGLVLAAVAKSSVVLWKGWTRSCSHHHVILSGAGIMGCSSGFFLTRYLSPSQICIIERDPLYTKASTVLSVSSIRQQFSLAGNIILSLQSIRYLKNEFQRELRVGDDVPDIQFVEGGYLFLATEEGENVMRENHRLQRSLGTQSILMDPVQLKKRFPWINTQDIVLASLGVEDEGWFDAWLLLNAFKAKLISLGVKFIQGEVNGLTVSNNRVTHVQVLTNSGRHIELSCDYFVNAAGPYAANIAEMAGIGNPDHTNPIMRVPLPVRPRKRQVFTIHCPTGPHRDCPLIVDTSGAYVRRESQEGIFIAGISPTESEDIDEDELEVDYTLFDERVWPLLAHRVPAFESLKVKGGWAGYYEYNTFDQNAIIGPHPVLNNFIFVNGFSGHGIQQSLAAGQAVSEIITQGKPKIPELSNFGFDRVVNGVKYMEKNIV